MLDENHARCVDRWMQRAAALPLHQFVALFDQALGALWQRAHVTLGDVTLGAIVDRVLFDVSERYPPFRALRLDDEGIVCGQFVEEIASLPPADLREGVRLMLTQLLTVLGTLTAEILTPALHAELTRSAPEAAVDTKSEAPPQPRTAGLDKKAES